MLEPEDECQKASESGSMIRGLRDCRALVKIRLDAMRESCHWVVVAGGASVELMAGAVELAVTVILAVGRRSHGPCHTARTPPAGTRRRRI